MQVTIREAKTQLSKLIAAAERGEEVIIARRDKPVVKLVATGPSTTPRELGFLEGEMPPDALSSLLDEARDKEIEDDFYAWEKDEARDG